jgi:DNA (cytosine-5)-methyltransferase 1
VRYISVCSGIEAATVAWHPLGWQAAAYSEIEPFPSAVLAHHYPDVPNVGDMTKFKEWSIEPGSIDLLVGGTPCQSFSVAGLRKGLADPRGNLALVYCGILDHLKPRWFVWENVPGVLSSGSGRDFGSFLGAVAELGYGFAYRVLDAQYFGVAQRRRRVFVVGHLGDWRPAAKVLFERESLRGDPAPRRKAGQEVAGTFTARARSGGWGQDPNLAAGGYMRPVSQPYPIANTLTARMHKGINSTVDEGQTPVIAWGEELNATIEQAGTLLRGGDGGRHDGVLAPVGFDSYNHAVTGDISKTLDVGQDYHHVPNVFQPVAFHPTQNPISIHPHCIGRAPESGPQGKEYLMDGSAYCMDSRGQPQAVVAPTLTASNDPSRSPQSSEITAQVAAVSAATMQVRRLTPVECERLQGFPDNYTAIPWRKKPIEDCPDGPRYKALGNSMAVPVMAWIGKRIANAA